MMSDDDDDENHCSTWTDGWNIAPAGWAQIVRHVPGVPMATKKFLLRENSFF